MTKKNSKKLKQKRLRKDLKKKENKIHNKVKPKEIETGKKKSITTKERRIKRGVPIIDLKNPEIHRYRSIAEVARTLGEKYSHIYNIIRHNTEKLDEKPISVEGQILVDGFNATFNILNSDINVKEVEEGSVSVG
jgi:hypothetical protein